MNQIKYGYARWLDRFHRYFVPTTRATEEWARRPLNTAMVLAPGRMVDAAEDMLALWRKNDNSAHTGNSSYLPIVITALAKDYTPTGGDYSRQIARELDFIIPGDKKERMFKLRQIQGDRRAQLLFVGPEEASARSMAMQFCQWITDIEWRRFTVPYKFAGFVHEWPVMLETIDVMPQSMDLGGQKNITALLVDITLRETIPVFLSPKPGEPNDGLGDVANPDDPPGFARVGDVNVVQNLADITGMVVSSPEQVTNFTEATPMTTDYELIFKMNLES